MNNNYLQKITIIFLFILFSSFVVNNKNLFIEKYENQEVDDIDIDKRIEKTNNHNINFDIPPENEFNNKSNTKNNITEITNENDVNIGKEFQTYGPTNYQDPNDMTEQQKLSFKFSYPNNMTLQDYVNWLILHKNEQKNLSKEHVVNLQKLLNGDKLEYIAGILPPPTKISPPLTSKDYFDNMYITNTYIKNPRNYVIQNSNSNDMMAYNYGDYPDFKQNLNVYGTSGRYDLNPDLFKKKDLKNFQSFMKH